MKRFIWHIGIALLLLITVILGVRACKKPTPNPQSTAVATPSFTPAAGTFSTPQSVTIATTTPGASLYYSLDGTTPVPPTAPTQTIFGISTTAGSNNPTPYPPIVRCCIGVSWDKIETARGVYDSSAFASVDSWISNAQAHGSKVMFSGNYTPTWASGAPAGDLSKAPSDWNTTSTCQAPLAGVVRKNCMFAEYYTKFMQHVCHVSSQPTTPIIGGCGVQFHEIRNEMNVGRYWTDSMAKLARLANDQAKITRLYCGDCIVVGGSASAGGSGTGGAYTSSLLSFYQAWQAEGTTQPPFAKPDWLSYHAYSSRTPTVKPPPFPTSIVSNSDSDCTLANTPNSSCTVAIMNQTLTLKGTAVACNASISAWACGLPVISTEGGWGITSVLTDGIDGNSANSTLLRVAYVSQYMIALQGSGTAVVLVYSWDDPCWAPHQGNSRHCSGDPNLPLGNLPWQAAFTGTQAWLQSTVFTSTAPTSATVTGGKIWTWDITYKGSPAKYVWFDKWLGSTSYTMPPGMFYAQYLNGPLLAGASAITIGQTPTLIYTSGPQLYTAPVSVPATMTIKAVGAKAGMDNSAVNSGLFTITSAAPVVADPVFSPVGGPYTSTQNVGITSATVGATICTTNDGTTPTAGPAGTCLHGTAYSGTIPVASTTTLKAIATKAAMTDSAVITATYTITIPPITVAAPTFAPPGGTYNATQNVALNSTTPGASICYTLNGTTPTATVPGTCDQFTYSSPIPVSAALTIKAMATKASATNSGVVSASYSFTAATPVLTPAAGGYGAPVNAALTTTTPGATIGYTTDGSTPTASGGTITHGTVYTAPIFIGTNTTIKAIATLAGYSNSPMLTGTYTISIPAIITSGQWKFSGNVTVTVGP